MCAREGVNNYYYNDTLVYIQTWTLALCCESELIVRTRHPTEHANCWSWWNPSLQAVSRGSGHTCTRERIKAHILDKILC